MNIEIANNSKAIRQRQPDVYQELFSRCFLVISTPAKFFWGGEYGAHIGAPLIGQNVPLRTYVGFEHTKNKGQIEIDDKMYVPSEDRFTSQMDTVHRSKLIEYFTERASHYYETKDFTGLRINTLSEISPGCGMGLSGSFATALAVALLLDSNKISQRDIVQWSKALTNNLIQIKNFDRTFRLAWKFSSLLHDGISSGGAAFMSFIGSLYPIIYFSEKRVDSLNTEPEARSVLNVKENYDLVNHFFYGGIKLDELFGFKDRSSWPIDFHLIYTGKKGGGRVMKSVREIDDALFSTSTMIVKSFNPLAKDSNLYSPVFYRECLREGADGLHRRYLSTPYVVTLEILECLKKMFDSGGSERAITDLFQAMNNYQSALRILNRSTQQINEITHYLESHTNKKLGTAHLGAKITGAGCGGDVLIATAGEQPEKVMQEEVAALRKKLKANIWLDYSSHRDGLEEKGLIVEQSLKDKIYSSVISQGSVLLDRISKQGSTAVTFTSEKFDQKKNSLPLLIDINSNAIFLKGKKLTSKEIKSAKTTIIILMILLGKIGHKVSKSELPSSSYTRDRNEFQSKIVSPLVAVIKKQLKKSLPLKVEGPITNYTVSLKSLPFDIYLLRKTI